MNGIKILATAATVFLTDMAFADMGPDENQDDFTYTHVHADSNMYCELHGDGDFTIWNSGNLTSGEPIVSISGAWYAGLEQTDMIDGGPMEGYVVGHYPNLFNETDRGIEIWDKNGVVVSDFNLRAEMEGNDVRIALDTNSAVEEDGTVSRDGAHCRIENTNYRKLTHTVIFIPLLSFPSS